MATWLCLRSKNHPLFGSAVYDLWAMTIPLKIRDKRGKRTYNFDLLKQIPSCSGGWFLKQSIAKNMQAHMRIISVSCSKRNIFLVNHHGTADFHPFYSATLHYPTDPKGYLRFV